MVSKNIIRLINFLIFDLQKSKEDNWLKQL